VTDDATFVLCIENNGIRPQALLLCESLRRFGGRHGASRIVAVAPRPGLGVDHETRSQLDDLAVEYVEVPLNRVCPSYGSANRVFAAAWVECRARSEWVVVLDSDTLFLGEPVLPEHADVGVRPIDQKSSATEGPDDPQEAYWTALAALHGVPIDTLPFVRTTDRQYRVRAAYNGGLIAVRRDLGILGSWAALFTRSVQAGLRPWKDRGLNVHASTGFVGPEASEYWGSNQAAAAFAIWSRTSRVDELSDAYNVPLPLLLDRPDLAAEPRTQPLIHVHYHWLFAAAHLDRTLPLMQCLGVPPSQLAWLRARLPI